MKYLRKALRHLPSGMGPRLKKWAGAAGKILLLLAVLAVAALPAVFMNSVYGYFPILFLAVLLLLSAGCLLYLRSRLTLDVTATDLRCERGSRADIGLALHNHSQLSCPKARAALFMSDLFGALDTEEMVQFTMAGKERVDFRFGMDLNHIGIYEVGISRVVLYDFLGILHLTLPVSGKTNALVVPRIRPISELVIQELVMAESEQDTRTTVVGGTDYTGVRDYAPGDPMKQIHWKLSAHSLSYLTKIQESTRRQEYAVLLDFAAERQPDHEILMDLNDCLVETALSLTTELAEKDVGYTLLFCDRERNVTRTAQTGVDDHPELMRSFSVITPNPDQEYPDAAALLQMEGNRRNASTNVLVVTSRLTEILLQELAEAARQNRNPELYYIVPAAWTSRELEKAAASLRTLDEYEIPWFMISTAVNLET